MLKQITSARHSRFVFPLLIAFGYEPSAIFPNTQLTRTPLAARRRHMGKVNLRRKNPSKARSIVRSSIGAF